ncbi:MAG: 2-amino-4-hydroxy-6-hydroxymethyldihydropteridine diphosphokinase [Rhodospirillales bacterium 20-64-7]|nr:MAG: 2-amino-4-hydroxy-6-hydroxymethyldihydropteridine diphosphokinase [Rhodospirillales bacterium 20-64-7]
MILIGIGANLPGPSHASPADTCRAAVTAICEIPGLSFVALSEWYRTTSIPDREQSDYCNGVVRMAGEIDPADLLARLHAIEDRFGRTRPFANAPRTLDLDIISLNDLVRAAPAPVLPHPRAHLRAFVLRPMLDVAPGWRHPVHQQGLSSLLAELPPQGIQPWHDEAL